MRFYLGIDVSKAKLDCCLLDVASGKRKSKSVENSAAGAASLLAWCAKHQALPGAVHVVMEPTGVYHESAALALTDAGLTVSLVNPLHLRRFADSLGALRKTDAADAALLARFGRERQPEPWQPPRPAVRQLQALLARRDALARDRQRERAIASGRPRWARRPNWSSIRSATASSTSTSNCARSSKPSPITSTRTPICASAASCCSAFPASAIAWPTATDSSIPFLRRSQLPRAAQSRAGPENRLTEGDGIYPWIAHVFILTRKHEKISVRARYKWIAEFLFRLTTLPP